MTLETPRLDKLLSDPLIRLVMKSDGVVDADLRELAQGFARRQERATASPAGLPLTRRACCNQLPI